MNKTLKYLSYVLVHSTKPNSEANNHIRQLQRSENAVEIWRQFRQRLSGGQRAQKLHLLQRVMNPKWTDAQQGHQFSQWIIDIIRDELETSAQMEENIKIATAINNLRGAMRQHLSPSFRPTTAWREASNIIQNFLVSRWIPGVANVATIEDVNCIKQKGKG